MSEKILLEIAYTKAQYHREALIEVDKKEWEGMTYNEKEEYLIEHQNESDLIKQRIYTDGRGSQIEWDELNKNNGGDQGRIESYEEKENGK